MTDQRDCEHFWVGPRTGDPTPICRTCRLRVDYYIADLRRKQETLEGLLFEETDARIDAEARARRNHEDAMRFEELYKQEHDKRRRAEKALKAVQWTQCDVDHCPLCGGAPNDGHEDDCMIGNALR